MSHTEPTLALAANLKVLHCFRLPKGGVFRHVCDLIRGQSEKGLSVGVVCDSELEDEFADQMLTELKPYCSLGVVRLPISRTLAFSDFSTARKVSALFRAKKPNIIHGHGAKGGAYARILGSRLGIKSVYTPHGGSLHYAANSPAGIIFLNLEKYLKRHTNGLIFESNYSADTYETKLGALPCDRKVIHNGLSETEFDQWTGDKTEFDFVFIGEIRKLKGIDTLLEAVSILKQARSLTVLLAGSGPDEAYFKQRIKQLNIQQQITISPPIFPATKAFNQGRCVVIPSLAESFPYIVLEALAAGVPLITTNVGGIPEIFGSYDARLLKPSDVDALVASMSKQMNEPKKAIQDSIELKEYVRTQFGLEKMQVAIIDYYQHILAS